MKKTFFLIAVLVIAFCSAFSQSVILKLEPEKQIVIPGRTYYIAKVQDNRDYKSEDNDDKEICRVGSGKKQRALLLDDDLESCFYNFLSEVLPMTRNTGTSVTMIVNAINCDCSFDLLTMKAKITLDVEFITSDGNNYKMKVSNSVSRVIPDSRTWSSLIEKDIIDAVTDLNDYFK